MGLTSDSPTWETLGHHAKTMRNPLWRIWARSAVAVSSSPIRSGSNDALQVVSSNSKQHPHLVSTQLNQGRSNDQGRLVHHWAATDTWVAQPEFQSRLPVYHKGEKALGSGKSWYAAMTTKSHHSQRPWLADLRHSCLGLSRLRLRGHRLLADQGPGDAKS